jgi:hypothetical protein
MKKKLKAAFTLALLMGIALVGQAQNGIKLNLKKGDKFKIEYKVANLTYMTQADNKAAINTEDILGSTYEITDVNQNIYSIKITFDYIKFQITPPKGMEDNGQSGFFDSRKPEDMEGDFGVNAKEVIGKSVAFTYDAVAKKLISVDHTLSVELTPMQVGPAVGMFPMTEDYLKAMAPKVFGGDMPTDAKLEKGYEWETKESFTNNGIESNSIKHSRITGTEPGKLFIELEVTRTYGGTNELSEAKVTGKETTKGKKTIDTVTGMLAQSIFLQESNTNIEGSNGAQSDEKTITTTVTVTKI